MKRFLIRICKKNPILYRIAKKVYRSVKPIPESREYPVYVYHCVYEMRQKDDLKKILSHYDAFKKNNTRLVIVVYDMELEIHTFMRLYPDVIFLSANYYQKYQKKVDLVNVILMDVTRTPSEFYTYL